MRFRKKPIVVEAMQRTGDNDTDIVNWMQGGWRTGGAWQHNNGSLVIPTLEGEMQASTGDWVIRGVGGEFYPCKPDIFEATYDPVEDLP